jgi:HEAT repeat protein
MSDSIPEGQGIDAAAEVAAADQLPPVEPPSPGFIVQLFLIPMLIVSIIVVVWLLFSWLAHMGSRPDELVNDLERMNHASWQQALTLGKALQDPSNREVARNPELAQRLADILQLHLDEGQLDRDHIWLRMYLSLALGEFESLNGIPVLVQAAQTERDPQELDVRRAALWAIGRLAKRNSPAEVMTNEQVMDVLERAAMDTGSGGDDLQARGRFRSTAAYVLGELPSDAARERLATMLVDAYPDVRYNAAVALSRQGDVRGLETLTEMLDPDNQESTRYEEDESQQWKRQDVMLQAIRAAHILAKNNPDADLESLSRAIEKLSKSEDVSSAIRLQAKEILANITAAQ